MGIIIALVLIAVVAAHFSKKHGARWWTKLRKGKLPPEEDIPDYSADGEYDAEVEVEFQRIIEQFNKKES